MATPTLKRPAQKIPRNDHPEVVDPRWLLKALAVTIGGAALLGYLALCLLIYQGSWQLLLTPSPTVASTPSVPFQSIRFDSAETGTPRLSGWWIPAESSSTTRTILFLHGGSGSLSTSVPELELLHQADANVFALDYRGFGHSEGPHPTEARMRQDAAAALNFLTGTRHIPVAQIVPCGEGLAAVLAADLAAANPGLTAVILDNPDPAAYLRATSTSRSRLMPMDLLMQEHFDIASSIPRIRQPRLLLADGPFAFDHDRVAANQALFRAAPDPKMVITFDSKSGTPNTSGAYIQAVRRFLDEYVPAAIPTLSPTL
jgi:pimeloyl-ACP methyl ester carboxylesterase